MLYGVAKLGVICTLVAQSYETEDVRGALMFAEQAHRLAVKLGGTWSRKTEPLLKDAQRYYADRWRDDRPLPVDNTMFQSLVAVHNGRRACNRRV